MAKRYELSDEAWTDDRHRVHGAGRRCTASMAFAELTGMPGDLERLGPQIRAEVYLRAGIPVGVSTASRPWRSWPTTLRRNGRTTPVGGVDLRDEAKRNWVIKKCDAGDVWGIGRRLSAHLAAMDIRTAWELTTSRSQWRRRIFWSVTKLPAATPTVTGRLMN
ncbi:DNA polymerase V subunit UmuC [compost metagenome]